MQELAESVRRGLGEGRPALIGRVTEVHGFSTLPRHQLVLIGADGVQQGDLLGRPGASKLAAAASEILASGDPELASVEIEIHGQEVDEIGLSCGGRVEVLLQPVAGIPPVFWDLLAERAPVALITRVAGAGAGPAALVVDRHGRRWGELSPGFEVGLLTQDAMELLSAGHSGSRRLEDPSGVSLIEAWVPSPRLVVVGSGEMVDAMADQSRLLGWEFRSTGTVADLDVLFDWAGATAALVVLSHDPHVDAPALALGLARGVSYLGAMGSRSTQSRRVERLRSEGISDDQIARIHRPIGLDLGGRRAPEVALAIAAEILACHFGRAGRSLKDSSGPIHPEAESG